MRTIAAQSIPAILSVTFMSGTPPKVRCPQCGEESVWSTENKSRPFCSERCKLIDLGCWADESYRVPLHQTQADAEDLPPSEI